MSRPGTEPATERHRNNPLRVIRRLRSKRRDEHERILLKRRSASPQRILLHRAMLIMALFALVVAVMYLDRDGLRDTADGEVTFPDVVYFTMVTVTTVGYGDIVPVSARARIVDAVIVTPIRLFVWFILIGTAYELLLQRVVEDWHMMRMQRRLSGHTVICGYGASGEVAASELLARGETPGNLIVIDSDAARAKAASERGYMSLHGEATREELLRVAAVERARAVIVCVSKDETTALIILTIRGAGSRARIIATVRAEENDKLLRTSGADELVSPWQLGGCLLASGVTNLTSVSVLQDLVGHTGEMQMIEREVRGEEIGQPCSAVRDCLLVALHRGERRIGFWQTRDCVLEAGDRLIVVEHAQNRA